MYQGEHILFETGHTFQVITLIRNGNNPELFHHIKMIKHHMLIFFSGS